MPLSFSQTPEQERYTLLLQEVADPLCLFDIAFIIQYKGLCTGTEIEEFFLRFTEVLFRDLRGRRLR